MLGWGADFPDATNFLDFHFGVGASPQFGTGFPEMHDDPRRGGQHRRRRRAQRALRPGERICCSSTRRPSRSPTAVPALAYKADVEGAHASPLSNESLVADGRARTRTSSRSSRTANHRACTAPTRPTVRRCGSASRSASRCWPTRSAVPRSVESLATEWESNEDLTEWTFTLRPGVTFHDGSHLRRQRRACRATASSGMPPTPPTSGGKAPSRTGAALFGGFLNPPPPEG